MEKDLNANVTILRDDDAENESIYDNLSDDLQSFWKRMSKGSFEPLNYDVKTDEKPEWLNLEKFKKGQKFARDNFSSLSYTVIHALLMLFTDQLGRKTFIFSKSFIPAAKAHKQILTIATAVKSWITNDIWDDGNSAARVRMKRANKMHEHYYREYMASSEEKIAEKTDLRQVDESEFRDLHKVIREDFQNSFSKSAIYSKYKFRDTNITISQTAATFTLFGLAGLVITYPQYYGFQNASEEDLEAYAHMWKALGYLLGIKDEYNFVNGELNEIRNRTKSVIEIWMRSAFRELDASWEYLARSFVEGSALLIPNSICTFEAIILDLINFLGVDFRLTKKSVSFRDYLCFLSLRFLFFLHHVPGFRTVSNMVVNFFLNKSERKLKNFKK